MCVCVFLCKCVYQCRFVNTRNINREFVHFLHLVFLHMWVPHAAVRRGAPVWAPEGVGGLVILLGTAMFYFPLGCLLFIDEIRDCERLAAYSCLRPLLVALSLASCASRLLD